ncbi:Paired amphipathic helix protein Sin3-like 5 [Hirschfeldia incana]|nr:Paired amphipathic helix protein Sin3-like 5 [Hirschfeldia incana]
MKRVRDEVFVEAQTQGHTVSSRGETNGSRALTIGGGGGGGGNMGGLTTNDALIYLKAVKDMFQDKKEKYDAFLALMKDFKSQRVDTSCVIASVKELFKGYDDLLLGFNTFLPKGYRITLPEKQPLDFDEAIDFVNKIKVRFGNDQRAYRRFLDILNMYKKESKSISTVYQEVTQLFQGHEDLLAEFVSFLPKSSGSGSAPLSGRNALPAMHPMHFDKRIKFGSRPDEYTAHSDQREAGDENLVAAGDSRGRYRQVEDNEDGHENVVFGNGSQKNNMVKGINELDLSNCVQCTPSYRHLPDDYPIPTSSYRNSLGEKVLNDHWVSVTSGSEDYSFKHMRKNQYEESLFRCEDDRFELDMLLESVNAAIKRVEAILEKINKNTISTPICIKEHLSELNLRCIERLYGDNGLDVIELLRNNSHIALPVILTRLKQKQEEWARCRFDFRKVWADVYAKNHHKSLDHRSFYFKQQDSKNLSTKGLVAEIKDISDRKHKEDPLHAFAVGTKPSFTPDLEFSYSDTQVHADLYQLIKYYCEEICASEQSDKVMKLWVTFLEPMFGVPSRSQTSEAMVDVAKPKDNQEPQDACEAVKDVSPVSNLKLPTPPTAPTKENPTGQGSSVAQETIQQDNLHVGAAMNVEDTQPPKPVSPPRKDLLMEGVENHSKVSDVRMRENKVEREEGELSPTESYEPENFEVDRDNGVESVQKLPDNVGSNKEQENKEGAVCTEAGAKSKTPSSDDGNKITQKLSEPNENASKDIASGSKFGGQVSSDEEHKGAVNCDRLDSVIESEDGSILTISERYLQPVKPLAKHVPVKLQVSESNSKNDSRVFYGNDAFYVLFRLHQMLYDRIQSAKIHSERKWKAPDPDNTSPDSYTRFMDALYNLLDGSCDNTKFEDECRAIIGAQSYVLFTLDKLVHKFVKHLHVVAADETDTKLLQLYTYENYRKPGRFFDIVYHENTRALLHDQNIYRIEYSSAQTRLAIQLMNNGNDQPEVTAVTVEPGFANYLQNDFLSLVADEERPGLFLKRNKANMSGPDESSGMLRAMEGLKIINEVECKMASSSSKVKYEPYTSDLLYRRKQKKPNGLKTPGSNETSRKRRLSRFHMCLNRRLAALP